ncbi:uncharacterized protein LOC143027723 [Oratosquilla oratoria]|uniref:uncharacterized protein LOC143027723 n=1 Tax=Oratosquilla oratoria TaxID=337810 RepID=UPI003F769174
MQYWPYDFKEMWAECMLKVVVLVVAKPIFGEKKEDQWIWSQSSKGNAASSPANITDISHLHNEALAHIHGQIKPHHQDPLYQQLLDSPQSPTLSRETLHPPTKAPWPITYHLPQGQTHTPKVNSPVHQTRNKKRLTFYPNHGPVGAFSTLRSAVHAPSLRRGDGTTKSRTVVDNLYNEGPLDIEKDEKYTTLDKLFQERGRYTSGNIFTDDLGGLDPREIFYADDDLVIIKGGFFNSDSFAEPQPSLKQSSLTAEDAQKDVSTKLTPDKQSPEIKLPPNYNDEYNGNIPTIIPPPPKDRNLSVFQPASTTTFRVLPSTSSPVYRSYMSMIPTRSHLKYQPTNITPQLQWVSLVKYTPTHSIPMTFLNLCKWRTLVKHGPAPIRPMSAPIRQAPAHIRQIPKQLPVTLVGDTDVNYLDPLPNINPDAELISVHP